MNEIKDEDLLEKFKTGDIDSFEEIFNRYSGYIKNYINCSVHNTDIADEIMQEVFVILYKKPEKYNGESSLLNFLLAIAKLKVYEYYRKQKNRKKIFNKNAVDLYDGDRVEKSALDILERNEDINQVNEVLKSLNPTYRRVIKLIDFDEMSYEKAAKKMNKTPNQIKITIHRARKALEKEMRRKYPDVVEKYSKRRDIISIVLVAILGVTLLTGLVYAALKFYQKHIENKESFKLSEIEAIPDEDSVNISRDHAKEIIGLYLDVLEIRDYDLDKVELEYDAMIDVTEWVIDDDRFKIWIDANSGNLTRYNNCCDIDNIEINSISEGEAINKSKILFQKLKFDSKYEFYKCDVQKVSEKYTLCSIIYAKKYDDLFNIYEGVTFEYILELNMVHLIKSYNYRIDDIKININKEEAINIIKEKYGNVEIIDVTEEYELIRNNLSNIIDGNGLKELKDKDFNSREELYIKRVWKVYYFLNGYKEFVYVDVKNGEIIYNDRYAEQEKKK